MKKQPNGGKLSLKKNILLSLTENEQKMFVGGDLDTPTINDNCDVAATNLMYKCGNTFYVCNQADWNGFNHETNCEGPMLTDVCQTNCAIDTILYGQAGVIDTILYGFPVGIPVQAIPPDWYPQNANTRTD